VKTFLKNLELKNVPFRVFFYKKTLKLKESPIPISSQEFGVKKNLK